MSQKSAAVVIGALRVKQYGDTSFAIELQNNVEKLKNGVGVAVTLAENVSLIMLIGDPPYGPSSS